MRRDPRTLLWDARRAAGQVKSFVDGRSREDYEADVMLRSAVERQFEIIGEALSQLSRDAPEISRDISDVSRIVAFRNVLIHAYCMPGSMTAWCGRSPRRSWRRCSPR
ncbi:MAG: HepT-like ribonuclease domain-containing protein [Acidimicrobiales bacterium]